MKPPGRTTLDRMLLTAQAEAERIEIAQDDWVRRGVLKQPEAAEVARRDDFAGMVRLIDLIMSDQMLLDRLQQRMRMDRPFTPVPAADADAADDVELDAETPAA